MDKLASEISADTELLEETINDRKFDEALDYLDTLEKNLKDLRSALESEDV